mmetsp:Transcript_8798/g.17403  ORF Transcript_8798/g.17403 Transcript_8798/m.17403 type:complete len:370 (-) Transcript_8798:73-1182(-)
MKSFAFAAIAAIFAVLASGVSAQDQASETVRVSVTLPVNVPLEVPAGKTFKDAATEFCSRNGISENYVNQLENALSARWQEMQKENLIRDECLSWQLTYGVAPNKSWGTMPNNLRATWIEKSCDTLVPENPPAPLVSLEIAVGDSVLMLRAFNGDTVRGAVERFCTAHSIDMEANGEVLINALTQRIQNMQAEQQQQQQQEQPQEQVQQQEQEERNFLFSIPFEVDGKLARLRVHEGDDLEDLVRVFCNSQGISIAEYGPLIRRAIIDTSAAVTKELEQQLEKELAEAQKLQEQEQAAKKAVEESSDPMLLLEVPISVDGKEFSMKLYDGDMVNRKISDFCKEHGLDESQHGTLLLNHIKQRTEALRNE